MTDSEGAKLISAFEAYKRFVPYIVVPAAVVLAAISADLAFTPTQRVNAEVVSMTDDFGWTNRRGCQIKLKTDLGPASLYFPRKCFAVRWTEGRRAAVVVRIGRISGQIGVMHDSADVPGACCDDYSHSLGGVSPLSGPIEPYLAPRPGDAPRTFLPSQ